MGQYDDILHLPHHVSDHRTPMSAPDRAAQFSPFAALVGYDRVIEETGRMTETERELSEEERLLLSSRLEYLRSHLSDGLEVSLTLFVPDQRKDGGAYRSLQGRVKRIDAHNQILVWEDGAAIPFSTVCALEGDCFAGTEADPPGDPF